ARSTMKLAASATKFFVRTTSPAMGSDRAVRLTALFQIALVIFFRSPEFRRRLDLRDNRPIELPARREFRLGCFGRSLLFRRMIKNHRAILPADVGTLAIQRRRIVVRPKNVEQLLVTDLRRIELDLDNFSLSGFVPANIFVTRIVLVAASVTDCRRCYALQSSKIFFHAPKTSRAECRFLSCHSKPSNARAYGASRTSWHLNLPQAATTMLMSCQSLPRSNKLARRCRFVF